MATARPAIIEKAPYKGESLAVIESRIQKGLMSYRTVGKDLRTIQDNKLYHKDKKDKKTFEQYCDERWGLSEASTYQIIWASKVAENLNLNLGSDNLPSQTQALALSVLEPEQQQQLAEETDFAQTTVKALKEKIAEITGTSVDMTKTEPEALTKEDRYRQLRSSVGHIYGELQPKQRTEEIHEHARQLMENY